MGLRLVLLFALFFSLSCAHENRSRQIASVEPPTLNETLTELLEELQNDGCTDGLDYQLSRLMNLSRLDSLEKKEILELHKQVLMVKSSALESSTQDQSYCKKVKESAYLTLYYTELYLKELIYLKLKRSKRTKSFIIQPDQVSQIKPHLRLVMSSIIKSKSVTTYRIKYSILVKINNSSNYDRYSRQAINRIVKRVYKKVRREQSPKTLSPLELFNTIDRYIRS